MLRQGSQLSLGVRFIQVRVHGRSSDTLVDHTRVNIAEQHPHVAVELEEILILRVYDTLGALSQPVVDLLA